MHPEYWMEMALKQADIGAKAGEVPVGAVLVYEDTLIAQSYNQVITQADPSAHAEINVLRLGAQILNNYRLIDTELYVTLEPCLMCSGALMHARVKSCTFAAFDSHQLSLTTLMKLNCMTKSNHQFEVRGGLLEMDSGQRLKNFFQARRVKKISTKPLDRSVDNPF